MTTIAAIGTVLFLVPAIYCLKNTEYKPQVGEVCCRHAHIDLEVVVGSLYVHDFYFHAMYNELVIQRLYDMYKD